MTDITAICWLVNLWSVWLDKLALPSKWTFLAVIRSQPPGIRLSLSCKIRAWICWDALGDLIMNVVHWKIVFCKVLIIVCWWVHSPDHHVETWWYWPPLFGGSDSQVWKTTDLYEASRCYSCRGINICSGDHLWYGKTATSYYKQTDNIFVTQ